MSNPPADVSVNGEEDYIVKLHKAEKVFPPKLNTIKWDNGNLALCPAMIDDKGKSVIVTISKENSESLILEDGSCKPLPMALDCNDYRSPEAEATTTSMAVVNEQRKNSDKNRKRTRIRKTVKLCPVVDSYQTFSAHDYDRTSDYHAVKYICDQCETEIPGGIHGFEPFASCTAEDCETGYDLCMRCLSKSLATQAVTTCKRTKRKRDAKDTSNGVQECTTGKPRLNERGPSSALRVGEYHIKAHQHPLFLIDRQAEVDWSNKQGNG